MESFGYGFDFINDLLPDETVQAAVWSLAVISGTDANPASHLQGPPILATPDGGTRQTATLQAIGGLLPDVTYVVRAVITTNFGNVRSYRSHVRGEQPL